MIKRVGVLVLIVLTFFSGFISGLENLDELESRTLRKSVNTFYGGESVSDNYIWQPQTLMYTDVSTGHEVWVMTSTPNYNQVYFSDMNGNAWSADGNRLAFYSFDLTSQAFSKGSAARLWFLTNADGTSFRPIINGPFREQWNTKTPFFYWNPAFRDVYYGFGNTVAGNAGVSSNILYQADVTDTGISRSELITLPAGTYSMDHGISSTGNYVMAYVTGEAWLYFLQTFPFTQIVADYSSNRPASTYWGNTPSDIGSFHGNGFWLLGNGSWMSWLPSGSSVHWKFKTTGTYTDEGSNYVHDITYPYDFGGEAEPINTRTNNNDGNDPWCDDGSYDCAQYMSHMTFDRWGTKVIYSNGQNPPTWGSPSIYDIITHRYVVEDYFQTAGYHDWHAWSDYAVSLSVGSVYALLERYDDSDDISTIFYTHSFVNGGGGAYEDKADVVQSPDGTKVSFNSEFLNSDASANDIYWAVAYYPHPPEVSQVSASSGTVNLAFDWNLDENSRGYTQRGWPDEGTDSPPAPREVSGFRLWRSPDGSSWIPISTIDHDIFERFDFVEGGFKSGQDSHWEFSDSPGDGTWYYGVTSKEWSGLESRTLSNVYRVVVSGGSGVGVESSSYPADPKIESDFYTSFDEGNADLVRYYNIYTEDGSVPVVDQTNRIASIPVGACDGVSCSWVDWLGNVDGSTEYVVTAVDSQGNEGGVLVGTSFVHQEAPAIAVGQYTIEWNAVVSESCELDGDEDGYGVGVSCLGLDCDDDDGTVWANVSCVWDGSVCLDYEFCGLVCPVVPIEVCGNGVSDDCDLEVDEGCESFHDADNNPQDGVVSVLELRGYIQLWLNGERTISQVMTAVNVWVEAR